MKVAKKLAVLTISAITVFSLTACGESLPTTSSASQTATPTLTTAQEKKIRASILETIAEVDESKDTDELSQRLTGPELDVRTSQVKIASSTGSLDATATIPSKISQSIISTKQTWPRTSFAITTTTSDQQSQRLLVMTQENATSNYKLWGVVRLFSGVKMPAFELPTIGSTQGASTDTGLVMTPAAAAKAYAKLLESGGSSDDFADDSLRTNLAELTSTVQAAITANEGTQEQTFTADTSSMKIMRSADGGDLVVVQIKSTWTRTAGENRESLPASDSEKALFGDQTATNKLVVEYMNVVALYIPSKAKGGKVRAVAAERQPISAIAG